VINTSTIAFNRSTLTLRINHPREENRFSFMALVALATKLLQLFNCSSQLQKLEYAILISSRHQSRTCN
jgi:hypothetical protein